jgi:hypothetical protein
MIDNCSRLHGAKVLPDPDFGSKNVLSPNHGCSIFFVIFLKICTVEAAQLPGPHFWPPDLGFRVKARRLRPDQVNYWEGTLQLLFHKLCMEMIGHGSRST